MSELKAIRSEEIYNIIEYEDCYRTDDLYYLKSEADRVIAHHKYKRCLAMAEICFERSPRTELLKYDKKSDLFRNFYDWWENRWLELADKFKEAK